jgi:hypothetical protein
VVEFSVEIGERGAVELLLMNGCSITRIRVLVLPATRECNPRESSDGV